MADVTTTTEEKKPTLQDAFKTRETESQAGINKIYDNNLTARNEGLLDSFNQNTQAMEQQKQNVQSAFQQANYDIGVQNDRNDRNLTQFADVRDVNTGLGSQHRLNLGNARAGAEAKTAFAQQQALAEADRQAALAETNYKNRVAAALADNDYKRAAALMDDYNNQNKWREAQAQQLASFGDFQAYRDLYGKDTADTMQTMWNAQHPEEAYRLGRISADDYKNITGNWPKGYTPPRSGGSYWGYDNGYVPPQDLKLAGSVSFAPQKTAPLMTLPDVLNLTQGPGLVQRLKGT